MEVLDQLKNILLPAALKVFGEEGNDSAREVYYLYIIVVSVY